MVREPRKGKISAPGRILSDQKLADMVATAKLGSDGALLIQAEALEALCHELLWHRGKYGAQVLALKVVGGAAEVLLETEPDGKATFGDLLERGLQQNNTKV